MSRNQSSAGINALGHAWRVTPWGKTQYIGKPNGLPGRGGVDWGWTDKPHEAMILTPYWQRRFLADQRRCGVPTQVTA
jgi:hypothetical protein